MTRTNEFVRVPLIILPATSSLNTEVLRRRVEEQYAVKATYAYTVPVRHLLGAEVWEGPVHVFSLEGHSTAARAFAWMLDGETPDHYLALESRAVPEAAEAVRLALL